MEKQTCKKCGKSKDLNVTEFYRNDGMSNGFSSSCISCAKAYTKIRYYLKYPRK